MIEISINQSGKTADEVRRNLALLYSSREGEAALDRDFGLSQAWIDYPTETAKQLLTAEIITKTKQYEPRAKVADIQFSAADGNLVVKVVIDIVAN